MSVRSKKLIAISVVTIYVIAIGVACAVALNTIGKKYRDFGNDFIVSDMNLDSDVSFTAFNGFKI